MRILHVIDTLEFGGAEKVLVALANAACRRHEVSVCCLRHGGPLARELDPRIEVFAMGKQGGDDLLMPLRLARRIASQRYDVVHTHNWSVFLEGGMAAIRARVPVVHTVHGPYNPTRAGWLPRAVRQIRHAMERRVAHRVRRVVAVSDAIRHYIPTTVGIDASRLTTIHNGIDGSAPASPRREEVAPVFISVGRLDAIKNQQMMLCAFAKVAAGRPAARLVLVGDGPQRPALQALAAELGIADRVRFDGFRNDVASALTEADVFLLSSRYEGISIALLEAMRAGLPTVATRVGGVSETVIDGQTGLLVEDQDAEGFARAMSSLASDPALRQRMGDAARRYQQAEFSLDRMLQRYEALYAGSDPTC
ncbi:MAG: glycosyltransferase [Pseudomonadota bacterium]